VYIRLGIRLSKDNQLLEQLPPSSDSLGGTGIDLPLETPGGSISALTCSTTIAWALYGLRGVGHTLAEDIKEVVTTADASAIKGSLSST